MEVKNHGGRQVVCGVGSQPRGPGFDSCNLQTFSGEPAALKFFRCQKRIEGKSNISQIAALTSFYKHSVRTKNGSFGFKHFFVVLSISGICR